MYDPHSGVNSGEGNKCNDVIYLKFTSLFQKHGPSYVKSPLYITLSKQYVAQNFSFILLKVLREFNCTYKNHGNCTFCCYLKFNSPHIQFGV